jgi:pSer/pThr/pTyr-binding forkhead associated (FHA) protein
MIRIVVIDKLGRQRAHHCAKREVTLGRGDKSDVVLDELEVSKIHARVVEKQGKHILVDLNSDNGVFVNRRRIRTPQVISQQDEIRIGTFVLRISAEVQVEPKADIEAGRTVCPRCGGPLAFKNLADYCAACDLAFT